MTDVAITRAANAGLHIYKSCRRKSIDSSEAYIRGLDYIIDRIFKGDMLGKECQKAIGRYNARTLA